MITVLHRGGMPKWLQYYIGGGVSRDPQKWLRNMCTTPYDKLFRHFFLWRQGQTTKWAPHPRAFLFPIQSRLTFFLDNRSTACVFLTNFMSLSTYLEGAWLFTQLVHLNYVYDLYFVICSILVLQISTRQQCITWLFIFSTQMEKKSVFLTS